MEFTSIFIALIVAAPSVGAFTIQTSPRIHHSALSAVGIFFGTSTGSTQEAAELIVATFPKGDAVGPIDIDDVKEELAEEFAKYDALIVGKNDIYLFCGFLRALVTSFSFNTAFLHHHE